LNKFVQTVAEAVLGIRSGSVIMIGGFGAVGQPNALIEGLIENGSNELTIIANNAGSGREGLARLMELGRIRKIICSFPRQPGSFVFEDLYKRGRIELEIVPQGTLAERIRAGGAGIGAFYTPTSFGTVLGQGKETRDLNGRMQVLEFALHADFALIEAWQADRWGNLSYRGSGRNFNPVMATAADTCVAQAHHIAELGQINPNEIVTPGIFVDRIVQRDA
jgi:3-oxoadipate CoA-transferase alpha subunit